MKAEARHCHPVHLPLATGPSPFDTLPMWHTPIAILAEAAGPTEPALMWQPSLPWWHFIVRGVIIYAFLIILLRVTGKRQVGQLAPFDLVLLLVLSNAVQNSMNGGDNSLVGGLVSAATLVALNYGMSYATFKSKRLEALIDGRPQVVIHNGRIFEDVLRHAKLTHHELSAALRQAGCSCPEEVHTAVLENNGSISVVTRSASPAAVGDRVT